MKTKLGLAAPRTILIWLSQLDILICLRNNGTVTQLLVDQIIYTFSVKNDAYGISRTFTRYTQRCWTKFKRVFLQRHFKQMPSLLSSLILLQHSEKTKKHDFLNWTVMNSKSIQKLCKYCHNGYVCVFQHATKCQIKVFGCVEMCFEPVKRL